MLYATARNRRIVQHNQVWQVSFTLFSCYIRTTMDALKTYAKALADAFLYDDPDRRTLKARGRHCLGYAPDWLNKLCKDVAQRNLLDSPQELVAYIYNYGPLVEDWRNNRIKRFAVYYYLPQQKPDSPAPFVDNSLANLSSLDDLCNFLEIDESRLHWLSDPWGSSCQHSLGPLQHYRYRWIPKKNNSSRLLEIPKTHTKALQTKINQDLLSKIPVHPDTHGFTKGRSTVSYTQAHLGKNWVLRLDLKNFFTSVSYTRIFNIFSNLGYPKSVVRQLTLLCTNRVPYAVLDKNVTDWWFRKTLMAPHLPQGAPTSPALSNLAAFNLDCRLSALAKSIDCNYSRYADDMLFSGSAYRNLNNLIPYIGHIVAEEGFRLNYRKTRVLGQGQRQMATGIVLNQHHNIPREEYQRTKAMLHNCVRKGVKSQSNGQENFHAHLKGKLDYFSMLNPSKAEKLEKIFQRIDWDEKPDT